MRIGHHHGVMVVKDRCRRSVVFTEGLWFSQRVCGFHRGSVVFTEGLWFSQRVCGVPRGSVVFTEGLGFSQRVVGVERPVSWVCGYHCNTNYYDER